MPIYTTTVTTNGGPIANSIENNYVNFEVVVGGLIDIRTTAVSGDLEDSVIHLYRRNSDGTVTLLASNDDGTAPPFSELDNVNLQPGSYFVVVNEFPFTTGESLDGYSDVFPGDSAGTYTVEIRDGAQADGASTSVVSISDGEDNRAPEALAEDAGVQTFTAESLIADPNLDNLTVVAIRNAAGVAVTTVGVPLAVQGGTALINANGDIEFTPTANYTGVFSFTYDVNDVPGGGIATGAQTGFISSVNDAPSGINSSETTNEDTPEVFDVGDFPYTDVEGHGFAGVVINTLATNGVLEYDSTGLGNWIPVTAGQFITAAEITASRFRFSPDANEFGSPYATFTFSVRDLGDDGLPGGAGGNADATDPSPNTFTMNVLPVDDDTFVAVDDPGPVGVFHTVNEDTTSPTFNTTGPGSITANDINTDPDAFLVSSISNLFLDIDGAGPGIPVQVGTISFNFATQTYTITPDQNFNTGVGVPLGDNRAYFDYTVQTDDPGPGQFDTGRVYVQIESVNDAPITGAAQNNQSQTEDQDNNFDINDADDNHPTPPDYPVTAPSEDNDPFDYQLVAGSVTRSVNGGAASPIGDGSITIIDQAPRDADYNYNDLSGADQALDTGEFATITFQYVVRDAGPDGIGGNADDATSAPQTITLTINGANDAPVAVDDAYNGDEDTTLNVAAPGVLANDTDVDVEPLSVVQVIGGTSTAGGTYTINPDGSFSYTPPANFNGFDTFNYTVTDGTASDVGQVTINVDASPDGPTAGDDFEGPVTEDVPGQATGLTPGVGNLPSRTEANGFFSEATLLANDTDPDLPGDTLNVTSVGSPINGTVQLVTIDGVDYAVFTPFANFSGAAQFDYTVTDSTGNSNIGTVFFNVNETADGPPVAGNDTIVVTEQVTQTITAAQLLGNDTDPDNAGSGAGTDQLFIRALQNLTNVVITNIVQDANGNILQFDVTTQSNQNGLDASFDYTVDDSAARPASAADPRIPGQPDTRTGTDIGTVTLDVTADQDAPTAVTDNLGPINEDSAVGITFTQTQLLANDTDPDNAGGSNAGLTVVSVAGLTPGSGLSTAVTGGTLTANANGTFTFVPAANFFGNATFSYVITDPTGLQDGGTVNIAVTSVNDAPDAVNDAGDPVLGLLQPANFAGSPVPGLDANDPISPGAPLVVEDQPATFTWQQLLANDNAGPSNENQNLIIVSGASAFGIVTVNPANQTVTFTPTPGYVGPATFTYTIQDGGADNNTATAGDNLSDTATVNVYVANNIPGSTGDDVIVPAGGDLAIQVRAGNGNDSVTGTANIDQLFGDAGNDTLNGLGGDDFLYGGTGNNTLNGGDGNDSFYIDQVGTNSVLGGAGNDGVFAGANFDAGENVDLGTGVNSVALQGTYVLTFGALSLQNVQTLVTASGTVAGLWPNPVPGTHTYNLTFQDANIAAGAVLTVIGGGLGSGIPGLQAGENLIIDATDEKDGIIRIFAGLGTNNFQLGEGDDGAFFTTGTWNNATTVVDGRNNDAGGDTIAFRGGGFAPIVLNGAIRVENIRLLSEGETQFGGTDSGGSTFDYNVTTANTNTAPGATLRIDGFFLRAGETLTVNANAETDGNLVIFGGAGNDTLSGGLQGLAGGTDLIFGNVGGDTMDGGDASGTGVGIFADGPNVYAYTAANQSVAASNSGAGIDFILGFDWTQDKLDVNAGGPATNGFVLGIAGVNVTDVNAVANGNLDFAFNGLANDFNANLAAQINAALNPGQAAVLRVTAGSLGGSEVLVVDTNNSGSYEIGDLVMIFQNQTSQLPPSAIDLFI